MASEADRIGNDAGIASTRDRARHSPDRASGAVLHQHRPAGFDQALDPTVVVERVAHTDARVIGCGHTHLPEVRDLGWKLIVNSGSAGYVFDGDPTASWALVTLDGETVSGDIRRAEFDALGEFDGF